MNIYFFDSSALVKRYVPEPGTGWIQSLAMAGAGHQIFVARITWVEVLSALARRQREGRFTAIPNSPDSVSNAGALE
jgi:uncharacterized protein